MAEVKMTDPTGDQLRSTYPSNSLVNKPITINTTPTSQQAYEKKDAVVNATATVEKQSLFKKAKKIFAPGDLKDAAKYAFNNVVVPNAKVGILAIVEMIIFGQVRNRYGGYSQGTNYSYRSSSQQYSQPPLPTMSRRDREIHNFQNLIYKSYQDAENVIGVMLDILDRDGVVRVSDLYELSGVPSDWSDRGWGWTSFQTLKSRAVQGGYAIDIQPPIMLNR